MNATKFLSGGIYVILPTKSNPKVYLSINEGLKAKSSFKLYNPFSKKAKMLKTFAMFLFVHCNSMARFVWPTIRVNKSEFITVLEERLGKKVTSSVYLPTDEQKKVLQLQDNDGIVGYLKYAETSLGEQRIANEKKAISTLSELNLAHDILLSDHYRKRPFIVLKNIEGNIGLVNKQEYKNILLRLRKNSRFKLIAHPRILSLKNKLSEYNLTDLNGILENICHMSKKSYSEVYEHGDFAPWNLIRTKRGLVPFDFEYYEERGLEHLDELKYHFQVEHLLNAKKGDVLIDAVSSKIQIVEFGQMFKVFLIKEILLKYEVKESDVLEKSLLKIMTIEKA